MKKTGVISPPQQARTSEKESGLEMPLRPTHQERIHDPAGIDIPGLVEFVKSGKGVICAATEYAGLTEKDAFQRIRDTIARNTGDVLARIRDEQLHPYDAALKMAREPIEMATGTLTNA